MSSETVIDVDAAVNKDDRIAFLENILANLPGHVYWYDRDHYYLGCNNRQAEAAGFASPREILGKSNAELPWADNLEMIHTNNNEVMRHGVPKTVEEIITGLDGKTHVYLTEKVPLRNPVGEVIGLLGVSFDITNRHELQKELTDAKQQVERALSAKENLIRNMEHDIRTPLSGIGAMLSYLQSTEEDAERAESLQDAINATEALTDYLNSIVEMSRLEAGSLPVLHKRFNLAEVVSDVERLERPAALQKGLSFECYCDPNVPECLLGDQVRIHRIVTNLVSNAIKFTTSGYVKLTCVLGGSLDGRRAIVKIMVEDTGAGIPLRHQDYIYEKYSCDELAPAGEGRGIGLGLHIVKQFMNELEGEIEVESVEDEGSTFTCVIPLTVPLLV